MTTSRRDSTEGRHAVKSETMNRPVTAESLTDEQILDLQAYAEATGDRNLAKTAGRALQPTRNAVWDRCRQVCAAAIRARGAKL